MTRDDETAFLVLVLGGQWGLMAGDRWERVYGMFDLGAGCD